MNIPTSVTFLESVNTTQRIIAKLTANKAVVNKTNLFQRLGPIKNIESNQPYYMRDEDNGRREDKHTLDFNKCDVFLF